MSDLIGIRFRPGGARPFLRAPASELVDLGAPLEAFWGTAGADLPERLYETVGDDATARLLFDELIVRRTPARMSDPYKREPWLVHSFVPLPRHGGVACERLQRSARSDCWSREPKPEKDPWR